MENFSFFSFAQVWNKAFEMEEERILKARNYIYASDIGGSLYDKVQAMRGIKANTPPNGRSLRKFLIGKFMEEMFKLSLIQLGLYKETQERIEAELPNLLKVSGRLDFIVGGKPNFEKYEHVVKALDILGFESGLKQFFNNLVKLFKGWFLGLQNSEFEMPNEIWELKTCSSMIFDLVKRNGKAMPQHENQIYHYVFNHPTIRNGRVIYLCKDDGNMQEFCVSAADERIKRQYFNAIGAITDTYNEYKDVPTDANYLVVSLQHTLNELLADENSDAREVLSVRKQLREAKVKAFQTNPPLENLLSIDMFSGLLSKNWKVEYSNYLTDYFFTDEDGFAVYFETPEHYRNHVKDVLKVNSVMKRFWKNEQNGKADKNKVTAKNQIWIDILENQFGYSFDDCYAFFCERQQALAKQGIVLEDETED
jgi:hypothetical protein